MRFFAGLLRAVASVALGGAIGKLARAGQVEVAIGLGAVFVFAMGVMLAQGAK